MDSYLNDYVDVRREPVRVLQMNDWSTPASLYIAMSQGNTAIQRDIFEPDVYFHYGIGGFHFLHMKERFVVTELWRYDRRLATDTPYYTHMVELWMQKVRPGRLLVAGLGLGIIAWYAVQRSYVSAIEIVESCSEVIDLIAPQLPRDPRIKVVHADILDYIPSRKPNTFFWNLSSAPYPGSGLFEAEMDIYAERFSGSRLLFSGCWDLATGKYWWDSQREIESMTLIEPVDQYPEFAD